MLSPAGPRRGPSASPFGFDGGSAGAYPLVVPWTLYRYILKDMLRLMVLTTAVLVLLMALAAAIKPLSDGLLRPVSLLRFVLYTSPTMLQLAVPFAVAFAGTLVFLRMSGDNEVVACAVSGMSYRVVLLPVLGLGLAMTLGLYTLSNWAVPWFYFQAARTLERDVLRLIVTQAGKQRPVTIQNAVLYADAAVELPPPVLRDTRVQPSRYLVLRGVVLGQPDADGRIASESTAERADLLMFELGQRTWVTIRLSEVVYYDEQRGGFYVSDTQSRPLLLPNPVRDKVAYRTRAELLEWAARPELYDRVRQRARELASALEARDVLGWLAEKWKHGGEALLEGPSGERYAIRAGPVRQEGKALILGRTPDAPATPGTPGTTLTPVAPGAGAPGAGAGAPGAGADGPGHAVWTDRTIGIEGPGSAVMVSVLDASGVLGRRATAESGRVWLELTSDDEPMTALALRDVLVVDGRSGRRTEHETVTLPYLRPPDTGRAGWRSMPMNVLVQTAADRARGGDQPEIEQALRLLLHDRDRLRRGIIAELHSRIALAVTAMLVLVFGVILSIRLRARLALAVYFWTFLLALAAMLVVSGGKTMTALPDNPLSLGLAMLWAGNLLLGLLVVLMYRGLARH